MAEKILLRLQQQVVGHLRGQKVKPKLRQLGKNLSFAGDSVGHDNIVSGNTVCGHEKKSVGIDFVNVSYFSSRKKRQDSIEIGSVERHCAEV